jgi:hypothetical protein
VVICTDYIGSCKSNYHTITATTAPLQYNGQNKKDKWTNSDLQRTTQKTKDRFHCSGRPPITPFIYIYQEHKRERSFKQCGILIVGFYHLHIFFKSHNIFQNLNNKQIYAILMFQCNSWELMTKLTFPTLRMIDSSISVVIMTRSSS